MDTQEKQILELKARIQELEKGVQADQIIRSIAINSPSNIMLLDLQARIQYINHTVPGITPAEMIGLCLLEIVEEPFRPGIRGALERVAKTGEPDRYETSYTSPSGDLSWWDSGVGPVLQDSKVTGYVVVSTNTTEQRRRHEEQERFFNLSVDMMCVAGFDGFFKRVNQAFRTTLGYGDELLERPFLSFVHPDDVPATIDTVARVARGEISREFCNRYRAANGTYRLLSWRGVGDPKREVFYAVARDITEARKLEDQLQQSRRMEAIGQLAGGIAHDFNNLLTAIKGNIDLAENDPELAATCLPGAKEAANRAAALTHQLLLFSRHQALSPIVLNLNRLLDNVMNLLQRLLPENITVDLQHAEDAPPILADQSQLEQVIMNLCVNARDAMPQGGRLSLVVQKLNRTEISPIPPSAPAAEYLSLSVTDTGCGMTPEVQSRIFEPFFTTKETGKGTGLGLATVYGIIQKHEGFLQVKSQPGQGTTIGVYLPTTARALPAPAGSPGLTAPVTGGTETILVAEDEPMVRAVVTRILRHAGYVVLEANDGQEAVRLFAQNAVRVSLALLDVVMPNLGGLETAARLRRSDPGLKVIFASGHVQNHEDQKRLEAEILLPKPYEREDLLKCIRRTLDA
jgi:PAS domain S-box-containing protein